MAKLEGIIYKVFNKYIVLRGFAKIEELAQVSKRPASYQRVSDNEHKKDIVKFLNGIEYTYFPDVILACRTNQYAELWASVGDDKDVDYKEAAFVNGLKVLKENLPYSGYRARHAYLEIEPRNEEEKLTRVDGNHRLEPFSDDISWWNQFIEAQKFSESSDNKEDYNAWLKHQAKEYRRQIEGKIIPFTIIFSDELDADKFEAGIFHNINFKQFPLREEASMRIISDLQAFDASALGKEYPLALEIIKRAKDNHFSSIPLLTVKNDIEDTYRTACLRIVKLLKTRKEYVKDQIKELKSYISKMKKELSEKEENMKNYDTVKIEYPKDNDGRILHESNLNEEPSKKLTLHSEIKDIKDNINYRRLIVSNYYKFLRNSNSVDKIEEAINSLRTIYNEFEKDKYGNISMLAALVYYKMLDKLIFISFVDWIKQNGINKITTVDDLPIHSSDALIDMFEEIYKAKRNEIFISMQFGDDQSEMIYEKIIQTIKKFEDNHGHIQIKPIRIDQDISPYAFTVSDEIMKAIKHSSLIIADLSSGNKNVYHEIGYAMGIAEAEGIKPPVILLYKTTTTHRDKEKYSESNFVGFNLRGLSQLRFSNYDELQTGLMERLKKHFEI
jgi:hypothetical protein